MKKTYLIIALYLFFCLNISAQSHEWQWAKTAITPSNTNTASGAEFAAVDGQGNILVTGYFWADSITFGAFTLYNHTPGGNLNDVFIVKYDPSGNVLWATCFGGTYYDYPNAIATDKNGNAYVVGGFQSDSITAGPSTIYNYGPTDSTDDIFVLKISSSGNFLWAKSFGGDYYDRGQGVATDPSGNVFIAAFFESDSILVGQTEYYNSTAPIQDHNDILIKCDSLGDVLWAQTSYDATGGTQAYGLSADQFGNAFMVGRFNGTSLQFGSQTITNQRDGWNDIFIVKYDSSGNALWANDAGGSLDDYAGSVTVDAAGNSYVTGFYSSPTAVFGSQQLTNDTTDGSEDIFVAKYDPNGNLIWANGYGGDQNDVPDGVAVDSVGNVYITGYYYSPFINFGGQAITNFDNTGATDDIFVVMFDHNGNPVSAVEAGGLSYDYANGLCTDPSQNVYVVGAFQSDDIIIGATTLINNSTTHNNSTFLAKYAYQPNGISRIVSQSIIKFYPNPASDMIIAESASFLSAGVTATVYDVAGNVIPVAESFSADRITFNTSGLAAGMYMVKFTADGEETNAKFIKVSSGQ
jgi:hypothetical protein